MKATPKFNGSTVNSINYKGFENLRLRVSKIKFYTVLWLLIYKLSLDLSYIMLVSKFWRYNRFFIKVNPIKVVESYILTIAIVFFVSLKFDKISTVIMWLFILISYVPMLTLYSLMDQSRLFTYSVVMFWWGVALIVRSKKEIRFKYFDRKTSMVILYVLSGILTFLAFLFIFKYTGISLNFDLSKVYQIRANYKKLVPLLGVYVVNVVGYIINPGFFVFYVFKRKWFYVFMICLLQAFLFSSTGMKSFLFAIPFAYFMALLLNKKYPVVYLVETFAVMTIMGIIAYKIAGSLWITSLFTRRTLFVPAQLSYIYYDFFSVHPHTYLSQHHIFDRFMRYPYGVQPPFLIGRIYFHMNNLSANNGIIGDAYMNFGYMGFVLWGVVLSVLLKLADSLSRNKDRRVVIALFVMPVICLTNSALITTFLTHGLLFSFLILYFIPGERVNGKKIKEIKS